MIFFLFKIYNNFHKFITKHYFNIFQRVILTNYCNNWYLNLIAILKLSSEDRIHSIMYIRTVICLNLFICAKQI